MKLFSPVVFAAIYGLTIRLLFGLLGDIMGIMSVSFFVLGPMAIGFLTVIFLPRRKRLTNSAAFFLPWLTCMVILLFTIVIKIEGIICWIMAYPLFAVVSGFGGIIANNIRKRKYIDIDDKENYDKWTGPDKLTVSLVALIPVIFGIGEGERLLSRKDMTISKSIVIAASPTTVWQAMANINDITPAEKHASFSSLVGFPRHIKTTLDTMDVG